MSVNLLQRDGLRVRGGGGGELRVRAEPGATTDCAERASRRRGYTISCTKAAETVGEHAP